METYVSFEPRNVSITLAGETANFVLCEDHYKKTRDGMMCFNACFPRSRFEYAAKGFRDIHGLATKTTRGTIDILLGQCVKPDETHKPVLCCLNFGVLKMTKKTFEYLCDS